MPKRAKRLDLRQLKRHAKSDSLHEVSVDDLVKQLLELFDHLGIDASKLAAKVSSMKSVKVTPRRLYPHIAAIGELLTSWHQDPLYLDDTGNPSPIRMRGTRRSFKRLASSSVPNMDPERLLFELERVGAVTIDAGGLIRVHMRSLPVYEDRRLAVQHTLSSLDGFIKTLRHNLMSPSSNSDQLFHRIACSGEFDPREIPALKIRVKRHGQNFLESCDNWMARRARTGDTRSKSKRKDAYVSVGVYLSVEKT
jgi:Family of unknown function (DUF6502)